MNRFWIAVAAWVAVLVAGLWVVMVLGSPLPTPAQELEAALHPIPPVSEAAARDSAQTIIDVQYPHLSDIEPTVERLTDYDIEHWQIIYTDAQSVNGVLVSIVVNSGLVEVVAFP